QRRAERTPERARVERQVVGLDERTGIALKGAGDLHIYPGDDVRGDGLVLRREPLVLVTHLLWTRREEREPCLRAEELVQRLRQRGDDLAIVGDAASRAQPALQDNAVLHARVEVDVDTVPVLDLVAVIVRQRREILLRREHLRERQVVGRQPLSRIGQSRGHGERELVVVGRTDRLVVHGLEVAVPTAEEADVQRHARENL